MKISLNNNLLKNISGGFTTLLGCVDGLTREEIEYLRDLGIKVFDNGHLSLYARQFNGSFDRIIPNSEIKKFLTAAGFKETK